MATIEALDYQRDLSVAVMLSEKFNLDLAQRFFFRLDGIHAPRLYQAVNQALSQFPAFHARFSLVGRDVQIEVNEKRIFVCDFVDVAGDDAKINLIATQLLHTPIPISAAQLFRVSVIRYSANRSFLVCHFNHLVIDGNGVGAFFSAVGHCYSGLMTVSRSFSDLFYAYSIHHKAVKRWQQNSKDKIEGLLLYQRLLREALPSDKKVVRHSLVGQRRYFNIDSDTWSKVEEIKRIYGTTVFNVLASVFAVAYCRIFGSKQFIFNYPTSTRIKGDISLGGYFVKVLWMVLTQIADLPVALREITQKRNQVRKYSEIARDELQDFELFIKRDGAARIACSHTDFGLGGLRASLPNTQVKRVEFAKLFVADDLRLLFDLSGEQKLLAFEYRDEFVSFSEIEELEMEMISIIANNHRDIEENREKMSS